MGKFSYEFVIPLQLTMFSSSGYDAVSIVVNEGFLGLYQGLGTQLIRVTPACAITFTSYEFLYSNFKERFASS